MYKYKKIKLKNGKTIDEHRLVWINNYGEIPLGMVVHHKDGNGKNNELSNLELIKKKEHTKLHMTGVISPLRRNAVCGTPSGYIRGCRCSKCREGERIRRKNQRNQGIKT